MSKSQKLGNPRCFVIFDPETGHVVKGMRVPPFRLKQQMTAYPGMRVMRVEKLGNISGAKVVDGKYIPGPPKAAMQNFGQPFGHIGLGIVSSASSQAHRVKE